MENVQAVAQVTVFDAPTIEVSATAEVGAPFSITGTALDLAGVTAVRIYRNVSDDFAGASILTTKYLTRGETFTIQHAEGASGVYYFWAATLNASGLAGSPGASHSVTVSPGGP